MQVRGFTAHPSRHVDVVFHPHAPLFSLCPCSPLLHCAWTLLIHLAYRARSRVSIPLEMNLWAQRRSLSTPSLESTSYPDPQIITSYVPPSYSHILCYRLKNPAADSRLLHRLFYGTWPDINGRGQTNLLVEQVSHHPPITAYVIENKQKGLRLVGHNAQKTSFSGDYLSFIHKFLAFLRI